MRAAYAEAQTAYLGHATTTAETVKGSTGDISISATDASNVCTVTVPNVDFKGRTVNDFSSLAGELPLPAGVTLTEPATGKHNMVFTYTAGELTNVAIS